MSKFKFSQQPHERISRSLVYTEALDEGDSLETVLSLTVTPPGLVVSAALADVDRVRLWASQGEHGVTYRIELLVETLHGERLEDEFYCTVKEL
jgi:hypothetical protein